jgi:nicotinic acid phosphoribosyltransferase
MYFAEKNTNTVSNIYIALFDNYINTDDVKSKEVLDIILDNSIKLANKEINYLQVDSGNYAVISYLVEKHFDYIKNLKSENLEKQIFIDLRDYLKNYIISHIEM